MDNATGLSAQQVVVTYEWVSVALGKVSSTCRCYPLGKVAQPVVMALISQVLYAFVAICGCFRPEVFGLASLRGEYSAPLGLWKLRDPT